MHDVSGELIDYAGRDMAYFPDEAGLIERMWGLICNSSDLKNQGIDWVDGVPVPRGLSTSEDSVEWRAAMKSVRDEYHNWLSWYVATHHPDPVNPDDEPTTYDLIQSLKMLCDCGQCDGAWVSRFEANLIIDKLKLLEAS